MTGPPLRQTRLNTGEPEEALARRLANFRVLRKAFLSATALASFSTCNVRPFIERVLSALGLDHDTFEMRQGIRAHEAVQGALDARATPTDRPLRDALESGRFQFANEYPLRDERRMLRGIADIVFTTGGEGYVIELKNTRPPPGPDPTWRANVWPEHAVQLQFYGLLAENDLGRPPRLALAYLKGSSRQHWFDELDAAGDPERSLVDLHRTSSQLTNDPAARAGINDTIRSFRKTEKRPELPAPSHADPRRCAGCRVRAWCPRRLDRPGMFEPLDAGLLELKT